MSGMPTPRTDAAAYGEGRTTLDRDTDRFADLLRESRQLERDLVEADRRESAHREMARLQLGRVSHERDELRDTVDDLRGQLESVTNSCRSEMQYAKKQRDTLAEAVIRFGNGTCGIQFLLDLAAEVLYAENETSPSVDANEMKP